MDSYPHDKASNQMSLEEEIGKALAQLDGGDVKPIQRVAKKVRELPDTERRRKLTERITTYMFDSIPRIAL